MSVLILHRVTALPDPLFPGEIDAARFDLVCRWIKRWFNVLALSDAVELLRARRLPTRALAVTFDDGYADNHDVALPILERHGLTATVFVASGFLDGGRMWNDTLVELVRRSQGPRLDVSGVSGVAMDALDISSLQARREAIDRLLPAFKYLPMGQRQRGVEHLAAQAAVALPRDLMMSSQQVRNLHQRGMGIGAHTVNHPILSQQTEAEAMSELQESRRWLADIIGRPVDLFAYPNGKPGDDFGPRDVALVRECGFRAAFTTVPGVSTAQTDPFQLRRYTPWRTDRLGFGLHLARNLAAA